MNDNIPCFLDDPTDWFILGFVCDSCNGEGCSVCNYSGTIMIYFNSEPNEPNVIGINERMVND